MTATSRPSYALKGPDAGGSAQGRQKTQWLLNSERECTIDRIDEHELLVAMTACNRAPQRRSQRIATFGGSRLFRCEPALPHIATFPHSIDPCGQIAARHSNSGGGPGKGLQW